MGPEGGFGEGLFTDEGKCVRALVEEVVQALIGTEAEEHFGAPLNAKGLPRPNGYRNGLKGRELRTRLGRLKLKLPQARNGSFLPSCLERRQTLDQVLAASYPDWRVSTTSSISVCPISGKPKDRKRGSCKAFILFQDIQKIGCQNGIGMLGKDVFPAPMAHGKAAFRCCLVKGQDSFRDGP